MWRGRLSAFHRLFKLLGSLVCGSIHVAAVPSVIILCRSRLPVNTAYNLTYVPRTSYRDASVPLRPVVERPVTMWSTQSTLSLYTLTVFPQSPQFPVNRSSRSGARVSHQGQ